MRMLRASMTLGVISAVGLLATLPDRKLTKEFLESEIKDVEYNRLGGTITHCTIHTKSGLLLLVKARALTLITLTKKLVKSLPMSKHLKKCGCRMVFGCIKQCLNLVILMYATHSVSATTMNRYLVWLKIGRFQTTPLSTLEQPLKR